MKINEAIKKVSDYLGVDQSLLKYEETDEAFFFYEKNNDKVCIELIKETGMILPVPFD